jgi:hypothetical protein
MRGTYYVCAGGCGAASPSGPLASADDIGALLARGHEIGCHTYSHLAVSTLRRRELAGDLDRNLAALESICAGIVPRNFAFPYGDMSFSAKRYVERRFDSCRSIRPGVNAGTIDLGALRFWPLDNASINRARIVKLVDETVRRQFSRYGSVVLFRASGTAASAGKIIQLTVLKAAFWLKSLPRASLQLTTKLCPEPEGKLVGEVHLIEDLGSLRLMTVLGDAVMSTPSRVTEVILVTMAGPMLARLKVKSVRNAVVEETPVKTDCTDG